jgi:hypothetical protein
MPTVIETFNDIDEKTPRSELLKHRWNLAGTTQITVIESAEDYLNLFGSNCPFDGLVYEREWQVFIAIAVSSNSGVRETIIEQSMVLTGELSFLKEFLDE